MNYFREIIGLRIEQFDPCPFCGNPIGIEREDGTKLENWTGDFVSAWNIDCEICDVMVGPFVTPTHAYRVWNKRVRKESTVWTSDRIREELGLTPYKLVSGETVWLLKWITSEDVINLCEKIIGDLLGQKADKGERENDPNT